MAARLLLILAIWAAIYLPGLGTLEIKGEEGRRILPAIRMLQTGNYVVPYVGSDPYFTKPPLVNWLVAASFKIFGKRNEWTARLPSALSVLAVALAFVAIAHGALAANGSLGAAIIWLTNIGLIEKGRLIEIEALYVSLTGLAIVSWLAWWQQRRSRWLTWTVPWLFLGLGLLAKGPLHLVFFYAVVLGVLYCNRELPALFDVAHVIGVIVMLTIFAAWAIPCFQLAQQSEIAHTWTRQISGRLSGEDFKLAGWLLNIPRGLAYFLPWTLLLAFICRARFADQRDAKLASGLGWAIGISFLGVNLIPGALPRYTMPLLAPAAWLVAMLLTSSRAAMPPWLHPRRPANISPEMRLPMISAALASVVIAAYAFGAMPFRNRREKVRNLAAQINAAVPRGEPLYAVDPDYQPFLFYVREPIVYLSRLADAPTSARHLLVQRADEADALASTQWLPARPRVILRFEDYRKKQVSVLEIGGAHH